MMSGLRVMTFIRCFVHIFLLMNRGKAVSERQVSCALCTYRGCDHDGLRGWYARESGCVDIEMLSVLDSY